MNLKVIENRLLDKLGNYESQKKIIATFRNLFNERAGSWLRFAEVCSTGFFIHSFVIQVINEKTLCSKRFTSSLGDIFI